MIFGIPKVQQERRLCLGTAKGAQEEESLPHHLWSRQQSPRPSSDESGKEGTTLATRLSVTGINFTAAVTSTAYKCGHGQLLIIGIILLALPSFTKAQNPIVLSKKSAFLHFQTMSWRVTSYILAFLSCISLTLLAGKCGGESQLMSWLPSLAFSRNR